MIEAYKKFWLNYFKFSGRSTRSDYWWVVLVNIIIVLVIISIITAIIPQLNFLNIIYWIATLIPGISLIVRRLHDINKSGWNCLLALIPIVGLIILLIYLCKPSVNENNKYDEIV